MNNDLLKISLYQGQQFNSYQSKIKKGIKYTNKKKNFKEGFVSSQQEQIVRPNDQGYNSVINSNSSDLNNTNTINQPDLDELNQLQSQYNSLMQQYTEIQTKISNSSLATIDRLSTKNPFFNKIIQFTTGDKCYVTNQGIAKYIPSSDIYNSLNIPKQIINIDLPWNSAYSIPGTTIPTNPPLISGTELQKGQSLGNEGLNVYTNKLINNPTSTYIGCYNDPNNNTMTPSSIDNTSFDKCQEYASNNSYIYFGLQNIQTDGTASCYVSNDINKIQQYGDASNQVKLTSIWSSNTSGSGATNCYVDSTGILILTDISGKTIWQSTNPPADCISGGKINLDTITATYGANCNDQGFNVLEGNATDKVKTAFKTSNYPSQLSFPINNTNLGDPAKGCKKNWDTSYQCGNVWKSYHIDYAEGQNFIFDCMEQTDNCLFFLLLQSDGNVSLCRGTEPSNNKSIIWSTSTTGKQKSSNPEWAAINCKFGRNYLKIGENIGLNEWIGSDDGSLKLVLNSDGNLVLYTSELTPGCKTINDKTYGESLVNAVYKLNQIGNKATMGKIGYINSESSLQEYPDSMIGFTNDYQIYQKTDSTGNDISNIITTDQNSCQTACNNLSDCAAYVYQGSSQTCWLKNKSAFPKGDKQYNQNTILGVRNPAVQPSSTCNNTIVNIDTIQYDNYIKGNPMTPDTQCNISIVSQEDKQIYDNIKSKLLILGQDIVNIMEILYNKGNNTYKSLDTNSQQFKKDLENYKLTNFTIQKEINLQSNNIEGMQNMNDLNGMLTDSDIKVLQSNYSYIMWSILAVGVLTITINTMKK